MAGAPLARLEMLSLALQALTSRHANPQTPQSEWHGPQTFDYLAPATRDYDTLIAQWDGCTYNPILQVGLPSPLYSPVCSPLYSPLYSP